MSNVYSDTRPLHGSGAQTPLYETMKEYAYSTKVQELLQKMTSDLFTERPAEPVVGVHGAGGMPCGWRRTTGEGVRTGARTEPGKGGQVGHAMRVGKGALCASGKRGGGDSVGGHRGPTWGPAGRRRAATWTKPRAWRQSRTCASCTPPPSGYRLNTPTKGKPLLPALATAPCTALAQDWMLKWLAEEKRRQAGPPAS